MKKHKIIFWIATSVIFIWEGLMPLSTLLLAPEYATVGTKPLGYPDYFAFTLIVCKVLGASAIMITALPATLREWAYAGLTFNLFFAVVSHMAVDKNIAYILMPVIVGAILAVSYIYSRRLQHGVHRQDTPGGISGETYRAA